jgi:hypothetical protein
MIMTRSNRSIRIKKTVPVPCCQPKNPQRMTKDGSWVFKYKPEALLLETACCVTPYKIHEKQS